MMAVRRLIAISANHAATLLPMPLAVNQVFLAWASATMWSAAIDTRSNCCAAEVNDGAPVTTLAISVGTWSNKRSRTCRT
jgi:hypothetical protein